MSNTNRKNAEEYSDILITAVDTLVQSAISKIKFDTTIVCEIVDTEKAEESGIYTVKNTTTFTAYSENRTYKKGDYVQVLIPNGDMDNGQKIILGAVIKEKPSAQTRWSPLKNFISLSDNLFEKNTNYERLSGLDLNDYVLYPISNFKAVDQAVGYNRLGIKFDILTEISEENLLEKDYFFIIRPVYAATLETAKLFIDTFNLASGNGKEKFQMALQEVEKNEKLDELSYPTMMEVSSEDVLNYANNLWIKKENLDGNYFSYTTPTRQEALFYLNGKGYLCGVDAYVAVQLPKDEAIYLSSFDIRLGLELEYENYPEGENLILISHVPPFYPIKDVRDEDGLSVIWFNKDKSGAIEIKNSEITDNHELHWFKSTLETDEPDPQAGYLWKNLTGVSNVTKNYPLVYEIEWSEEKETEDKTERNDNYSQRNNYNIVENPTEESYRNGLYYLKTEKNGIIKFELAQKEYLENGVYYIQVYNEVEMPTQENYNAGLYYIKEGDSYTLASGGYNPANIYYTIRYERIFNHIKEEFFNKKYYILNSNDIMSPAYVDFDESQEYYHLLEIVNQSSQEDFDKDLYYSANYNKGAIPFYEKSKTKFSQKESYYRYYDSFEEDSQYRKLSEVLTPTIDEYKSGSYYIKKDNKFKPAYDKFDENEKYYKFNNYELAPVNEETGLLKLDHENSEYWVDKWWALGYKKDEQYYNIGNNWIIGVSDVETYLYYDSASEGEYSPEEVYYYRTFEEKNKEEVFQAELDRGQYYIYDQNVSGNYSYIKASGVLNPKTTYYTANYIKINITSEEEFFANKNILFTQGYPSNPEKKVYPYWKVNDESNYRYCIDADSSFKLIKKGEADGSHIYYKIKEYKRSNRASELIQYYRNNQLFFEDHEGIIHNANEYKGFYITNYETVSIELSDYEETDENNHFTNIYYIKQKDSFEEYWQYIEPLKKYNPNNIIYYNYPYAVQLDIYEGVPEYNGKPEIIFSIDEYQYYIDESGFLQKKLTTDLSINTTFYILPYILIEQSYQEDFLSGLYYIFNKDIKYYILAKTTYNPDTTYYRLNINPCVRLTRDSQWSSRKEILKLKEVFHLIPENENKYFIKDLETGDFYYYSDYDKLPLEIQSSIEVRKSGGFFDNIINFDFMSNPDFHDFDLEGSSESQEKIEEKFFKRDLRDVLENMKTFHFDNYDPLNQFFDYNTNKMRSTDSIENFDFYQITPEMSQLGWGVTYYLPRFYDENKNEVSLETILNNNSILKSLFIRRKFKNNNESSNQEYIPAEYYSNGDRKNQLILSLSLKELFMSQYLDNENKYDFYIQPITIPFYYKHANIQKLSIKELNNMFNLDTDTSIKVALYNSNKELLVESNIIDFKNTNPITPENSLDLIKDLKLDTDDSYHGSYFIYNQVGKLAENSSNARTKIYATFKLIYSGVDSWDYGPIKIDWVFPTDRTMIEAVTGELSSELVITEDDFKNCKVGDYIEKKVNAPAAALSTYFNEGYTNNIVKCIITKTIDGKDYKDEGVIDLKFAREGSSGTKYTFKIQPIEGSGVLYPNLKNTSNELKYIILKATLIDPTGVPIDISEDVTWSFDQKGQYIKEDAEENQVIRFYEYNSEENKVEDKNSPQYHEVVNTNTVAVGTDNQVVFDREGLKDYLGYIVKATLTYTLPSLDANTSPQIVFTDYYAVPVAVSDIYQGHAPAFLWYDSNGKAISSDSQLRMSIDNTLISSEKVTKLNNNIEKSDDAWEKVTNAQEKVDRVVKNNQTDFKTNLSNFATGILNTITSSIKPIEGNGRYDAMVDLKSINNHIEKVNKLIEECENPYDFSLETFNYTDEQGIEKNHLTEVIEEFRGWQRKYPEIYENEFFYKNSYTSMLKIQSLLTYNENYRAYLEVKKEFNETIAPYLDENGESVEAIYFWDVEIIDALINNEKEEYEYFEKTDIYNNTGFQLLNAPIIISQQSGKYNFILKTPSLYFDIFNNTDSPTHLALVCYRLSAKDIEGDNTENNPKRYKSSIVWAQPLKYLQYAYGIDYINEWDGSTIMDSAGGKIYTSVLIAGTKNKENKFSGMIVGDVEKIDSSGKSTHYGLLGQKNGLDTFGLDLEGRIFIGPSGYGQIKLDGVSGFLTLGQMQMRQNMFCAPDTGTGHGVGMVGRTESKDYVAFYAGYTSNNKGGILSKGTPFERSNWEDFTNFYVLHNGFLKANNVDIQGIITAKGGQIGNLVIGVTKSGANGLLGGTIWKENLKKEGNGSYSLVMRTGIPTMGSSGNEINYDNSVIFGVIKAKLSNIIDIDTNPNDNYFSVDNSTVTSGKTWKFALTNSGLIGSYSRTGYTDSSGSYPRQTYWEIFSDGTAVFNELTAVNIFRLQHFSDSNGAQSSGDKRHEVNTVYRIVCNSETKNHVLILADPVSNDSDWRLRIYYDEDTERYEIQRRESNGTYTYAQFGPRQSKNYN